LSAKVLEITENGVVCQEGENTVFYEADTVIYAAGLKPRRAEAAALALIAPDTIR
jgi:NADH dehydrogenase FAD-containing subunit